MMDIKEVSTCVERRNKQYEVTLRWYVDSVFSKGRGKDVVSGIIDKGSGKYKERAFTRFIGGIIDSHKNESIGAVRVMYETVYGGSDGFVMLVEFTKDLVEDEWRLSDMADRMSFLLKRAGVPGKFINSDKKPDIATVSVILKLNEANAKEASANCLGAFGTLLKEMDLEADGRKAPKKSKPGFMGI